MSKIKINNAESTTLTIEHKDGEPKADVYSRQLVYSHYPVVDVTEMRTLTNSPDTIVTTDGRFGSNYFKKVASGTENGGTIIVLDNGDIYELQYEGVVNVKWFGVSSADDLVTTQSKLSTIFSNNFYSYYIPHDINYGYTRNTGDTLENLVAMPNLDFIVNDESLDNGYTDPAHQGAQTRVYYNNIDATDGGHNSFDYKTSKHHIGSFYMLEGDGINTAGDSKVRNATTFFGINGEAYWGIGMGKASGASTDTDVNLTPFKIIANKYRGVTGLTNVFNINNETGYFSFRVGANPAYKYDFKFEDKVDGTFTGGDYTARLLGTSSSLPSLLFSDGTNDFKITATASGADLYDETGQYASLNRGIFKVNAGQLRFNTYLGIYGSDASGDRLQFANNAGSTRVDMDFANNNINIIENLTLSSLVIIASNVPTADPLVLNQVWSNAGVLTLSAG